MGVWLPFFAAILLTAAVVFGQIAPTNIVCRYNSNSFQRPGLGKMDIADLEPALSVCTHLVYGHAGIREDNHKIVSLYPMIDLDLDGSSGHYRLVTRLKQRFPKLKIVLSVGGNADQIGNNAKYLTLLESSASRLAFINSAYSLVKAYDFDGIDLAWQFPTKAPLKKQTGLSNLWSSVKSFIGTTTVDDVEKQKEHRDGFSFLLEELKRTFDPEHLAVFLTINPNVNTETYIDNDKAYASANLVTLPTYDFWTPTQTPNEASHPAPLSAVAEVFRNMSINGVQASKTIIAIPTFGRSWALELDSTSTGIPPIANVERIGLAGPLTERPGLLSYAEMCAKILNDENRNLLGRDAPLTKGSNVNGSYAFRLPNDDGQHGIWVGFEDVSSANRKVDFVKQSHLAGVAVVDLDLDDFRGSCSVGEKFPILNAVKRALDKTNAAETST